MLHRTYLEKAIGDFIGLVYAIDMKWSDHQQRLGQTARQAQPAPELKPELQAAPKAEPQAAAPTRFEAPVMPETIADTGIDRGLLLELLVKAMYVTGRSRFSALAEFMKISRAVLHTLFEDAREMLLVETLGTQGEDATAEMRYALTSKGRNWAIEALTKSQYVGPVPVPFTDFCRQVEKQNILKERVHRDMLTRSFSHLVLPDELVQRLGPAVNSGKSILLYGPPGNGKTCIAEAIGRSFRNAIYLPYCIEVDGQIINFYDETVHHRVEAPRPAVQSGNGLLSGRSNRPDPRWILCRRPVVATGGELTLGMLDLSFNSISKFYEAPLQFKATGGIFVIDDFGRQQHSPQALLNRWIVPLERGIDYLTLHTGKTFPVPFNELVVFSTNIRPNDLSDEATLRRLYYKIEVPIPTEEDYCQIFRDVCTEKELPLPEDILPYLFSELYSKGEVPRGGYQPKYIVDQVIAQCEYENIPAHLDKNLVRMAWLNLFAN